MVFESNSQPTPTVFSYPASPPNLNHIFILIPLQGLHGSNRAMSRYSWVIVVVIFASLYLAFASHLPSHQKQPTATELKYSSAHSLGSGYTFDPRDGWQTVNVSNLSYKYGQHSPNTRRTTKAYSSHGALPNKVKAVTSHPLHDTIPKKVTGIMKTVLDGLKGLGKSETVTTTW